LHIGKARAARSPAKSIIQRVGFVIAYSHFHDFSAKLIPLCKSGRTIAPMKDEAMRAGANPAKAAPPMAQDEEIPAATIRRAAGIAVVHLEDNLLATASLLQRCRKLEGKTADQELDTIRTAVRLLRAQSDAAEMLARVARGESRHRLIVEFAGLPEGRLNSKFFPEPPPPVLACPDAKA
jgi:hypothetical protein